MSSNYMTTAQLVEQRRKEEIALLQKEIGLSRAFNIKLEQLIVQCQSKCNDILSDESLSSKSYIKVLLDEEINKLVPKLNSIKIIDFNLSRQELLINRNSAEASLSSMLLDFNNSINGILDKVNTNIEESHNLDRLYEEISSLKQRCSILCNISLEEYSSLSISKERIINEIDSLLFNDNILDADRLFLEKERNNLISSNDEIEVKRLMETFILEKRNILSNIANVFDMYCYYKALVEEYNQITKSAIIPNTINEFQSISEIDDRINNIMHNICELKEKKYIQDSILKVLELHGYNVLNDQDFHKIKILHKENSKTALEVINNHKTFRFEIVSLARGQTNKVSRDLSDDISNTIEDRIAFCHQHPQIVKQLEKLYGIKLNTVKHSDDPYEDPINAIEINDEKYDEIFKSKNHVGKKVKYENM